MIPVGLALAGAGMVANGIGQAQGARSLANAKRGQLAEQEAFQKEGNAETGAAIENGNAALGADRATAAYAAPGQALLEGYRDYQPLGLGLPARAALSGAMGATVADAQEGNQRLARANGRAEGGRGLGLSLANLQDKNATLRGKFARKSALYGIQDQLAAGHGSALRQAGNIATAIGTGMAGSGLGEGGPDAPAADPASDPDAYRGLGTGSNPYDYKRLMR